MIPGWAIGAPPSFYGSIFCSFCALPNMRLPLRRRFAAPLDGAFKRVINRRSLLFLTRLALPSPLILWRYSPEPFFLRLLSLVQRCWV